MAVICICFHTCTIVYWFYKKKKDTEKISSSRPSIPAHVGSTTKYCYNIWTEKMCRHVITRLPTTSLSYSGVLLGVTVICPSFLMKRLKTKISNIPRLYYSPHSSLFSIALFHSITNSRLQHVPLHSLILIWNIQNRTPCLHLLAIRIQMCYTHPDTAVFHVFS